MRLFTLLIMILFLGSGHLAGQSEEKNAVSANSVVFENPAEEDNNTKIFPVPVTNNRFTITSDKEFTFVRLTNIIGQETTREKFSYPRKRAEISFSNAQKGIYLVIIEFKDRTRIVKKILIDSP